MIKDCFSWGFGALEASNATTSETSGEQVKQLTRMVTLVGNLMKNERETYSASRMGCCRLLWLLPFLELVGSFATFYYRVQPPSF